MISRIISLLLLIILIPFFIVIYSIILIDDGFPVFFRQKRVGKNNKNFEIIKFRTMKKDTKDVATHLVSSFENNILFSGNFLRKYSIDELPQLINIINGQMNFIGPRPALHNQHDLVNLRNNYNISILKPGVTGWAQVNGRDDISLEKKVKLDYYYLKNRSLILNFKILLMTLIKVIFKEGISH
jgi:O-antigen biosynthesis protein WbqP